MSACHRHSCSCSFSFRLGKRAQMLSTPCTRTAHPITRSLYVKWILKRRQRRDFVDIFPVFPLLPEEADLPAGTKTVLYRSKMNPVAKRTPAGEAPVLQVLNGPSGDDHREDPLLLSVGAKSVSLSLETPLMFAGDAHRRCQPREATAAAACAPGSRRRAGRETSSQDSSDGRPAGARRLRCPGR